MCALQRGGRVLGLVVLHRRDAPFDAAALHALPLLAGVAELTAENLRLRDELEVDRERGEALALRLRNPLAYLQSHLRMASDELRGRRDPALAEAEQCLAYARDGANRIVAVAWPPQEEAGAEPAVEIIEAEG